MAHRIPSIDKVWARSGWKPERTLDQTLADVIAYAKTLSALAEV